jgi:prefoldin subunit 5
MSLEAGEIAAATRLGPLTVAGGARRARQALPAAVRRKLETLETDAEVARVRAQTLNDQARALRDEEQRLARRLEELRATHPTLHPGTWVRDPNAGPTARTWQPAVGDNLDDLAHDLEQTTTELARLTSKRDAAQARWNTLAQIAERSRAHLGVPAT